MGFDPLELMYKIDNKKNSQQFVNLCVRFSFTVFMQRYIDLFTKDIVRPILILR